MILLEIKKEQPLKNTLNLADQACMMGKHPISKTMYTFTFMAVSLFALFSASSLLAGSAFAVFGSNSISLSTKDRTDCVPKSVQAALRQVADRFGRVTIKSAFRDKRDNARRGGAKGSLHIQCRAVDFLVPGRESKSKQRELASYMRQLKAKSRLRYNVYCSGRSHLDDSSLRDGYSTCVGGGGSKKSYKRQGKYNKTRGQKSYRRKRNRYSSLEEHRIIRLEREILLWA